ncbi:MAG: radical SAM protein, partial [Ilumatobacteraceae bacterium]
MTLAVAPGEFGVYVHVPFCSSKCDYCAFATWTDRAHLVDAYMATMETEIGRAVDGGMPVATSVFVGGGTPSLVPGESLAGVISAIPVTTDAEITVECNPDNVDETLLATYRDAGVNRVSIGV